MLDEQQWGLAILVSQKLARALPKPTWHVLLRGTHGEALRPTQGQVVRRHLANANLAQVEPWLQNVDLI
jgi:hypothetical protein